MRTPIRNSPKVKTYNHVIVTGVCNDLCHLDTIVVSCAQGVEERKAVLV